MKSSPPAAGVKQVDADLTLGMRHLAEANTLLLRQRRLIWRLTAHGESTADADAVFSDMIQTLRIMRERLTILEIAGDASKSPLATVVEKPPVIAPPLALKSAGRARG